MYNLISDLLMLLLWMQNLSLYTSWRRGSRGIASFITSVLVWGDLLASPLGRTPSMHWIGGWLCLRAGLNVFKKRKISCSCWYADLDCAAYSVGYTVLVSILMCVLKNTIVLVAPVKCVHWMQLIVCCLTVTDVCGSSTSCQFSRVLSDPIFQ